MFKDDMNLGKYNRYSIIFKTYLKSSDVLKICLPKVNAFYQIQLLDIIHAFQNINGKMFSVTL